MKKTLFIILSIVLVSKLYAQELKFIGGASLSKYNIWPEVYFDFDMGDEYSYEINYKRGFLLGCGIEFTLTRNIAIEIDGLYFQKGSKVQRIYSHIEIYVDPKNYSLNVVSIPTLLKIKFLPGSSPYVLGGGEFSIILSHDEVDIKENYESFDYGLVFGAGFEMKMPGASFFIEGRYHLGINNIIKDPVGDESIKTKAIVAIVGIKI